MTITNPCNDKDYTITGLHSINQNDMSSDAANVNLSDSVHLMTKSDVIPCVINLTRKVFTYQAIKINISNGKPSHSDNTKEKILFIEDIIGCSIDERQSYSTSNAILNLIAYPIKRNQRKRKSVKFIISKYSTWDENYAQALHWKTAILDLNHGDGDARSTKKKLMIIINPKSGQSLAMKIFKTRVKPLLVESDISYDLHVTEYPNHAMEYVRDMQQITDYEAIVVVSGDGLLFEVVNGLASRSDRNSLDPLPISLGIIPGGSGNGLAYTINKRFLGDTQSVDTIFDCTLHVTRGKDNPMDLIRVITPTNIYYSFLSFGWGILADIDIESERLRMIGAPRFTLWGFYRSMALRKYHAKISYLPVDGNSDTSTTLIAPPLDSTVPEEWLTIEDDFILIYSAYQTNISSSVIFAPDAKFDDGIIWLLLMRGNVSRKQVVQFLLALEKCKHTALPYVTFLPVKAFRIEPTNNAGRLTIDGEVIESSVAQVEVIPRMATILTR